MDAKDLRIIKNIYCEQTAAVKIENETCAFQDIIRGVRQGCLLSPDIFNLYSETILRELEDMPELKIGGKITNNLKICRRQGTNSRKSKRPTEPAKCGEK